MEGRPGERQARVTERQDRGGGGTALPSPPAAALCPQAPRARPDLPAAPAPWPPAPPGARRSAGSADPRCSAPEATIKHPRGAALCGHSPGLATGRGGSARSSPGSEGRTGGAPGAWDTHTGKGALQASLVRTRGTQPARPGRRGEGRQGNGVCLAADVSSQPMRGKSGQCGLCRLVEAGRWGRALFPRPLLIFP